MDSIAEFVSIPRWDVVSAWANYFQRTCGSFHLLTSMTTVLASIDEYFSTIFQYSTACWTPSVALNMTAGARWSKKEQAATLVVTYLVIVTQVYGDDSADLVAGQLALSGDPWMMQVLFASCL